MSGCDGWRHQGFIKAGRTQSQTVPRQWLLRILQRPPYQHLTWGERGRGRERGREAEGEGGTDIVRGAQTVPREVGREREREIGGMKGR